MDKIEWQFIRPNMVVKNEFWRVKILKDMQYNCWMDGLMGECTAEVEVLETTTPTLEVGQIVSFAAKRFATFELVSEV